ncbi:MAG: hypothetical protein Q9167_003538 [Letrouitia subvulpina]
MKTYSKKRKIVPSLFQDTPPLPKQKIFPHRRQTITPKTPSSTISNSRWKQQTLTQQVPDLQRTRSEEDLEGLEEYDVAAMDIPPSKNRRASSKPQREQQQTITQMDSIKSLLYPQEEFPDPVLDENEDIQPKRKKAKTTIVQPSARKPRSRFKAAEAAQDPIPQENRPMRQEKRQNASETLGMALLPPPKTPKSNRRTEIPSSQSPADSPIYILGSRSLRQSAVSPLKERSVNVASKPPPSRRQTRSGAQMLEIADSIYAEKWGYQTPTCAIPRVTTRRFPQKGPKSPPESTPFLKSSHGSTITESSEELPLSEYNSVAQESFPYKKSSIKLEIQETANEHYNENGETEESEIIELTQAIPSSSADSLDHSIHADPLELQLRTSETPRSLKTPLDQTNHAAPVRIDLDHQNGSGSETTLRLPQVPQSPLAQISAFTNDESTDAIHSDSELASAQLTNDLQRYSSAPRTLTPPVLETESQFENAWRALPQSSSDDQYEQGHLQEQSLSAEEHPAMPEQSLPMANKEKHPVPSSQATTTDITQASARQGFSDPFSRRPSTQLFTSSPRANRSSLSLSPFQLQKAEAADMYVGYGGWNGVRMTDSQLLPDSLVNASVPEPPPFSQESLLEDER